MLLCEVAPLRSTRNKKNFIIKAPGVPWCLRVLVANFLFLFRLVRAVDRVRGDKCQMTNDK